MDTQGQAAQANLEAAKLMNAMASGRTCAPGDHYRDLSLLTSEQAKSWVNDGYFIIPRLVAQDICTKMSEEAISLFTSAETGATVMAGHHAGAGGQIAVEEAARIGSGEDPDQRMSKLYNIHRQEPFLSFAKHPVVMNAMRAILGPAVSCFNSQYIFKNPGVWGQPWHQDSLYFHNFSLMPQVGVWLATTRATAENGCLFVAPGSHREPIHTVVPDRRPGSNYGYMEVVDYDYSRAVPVLMEPGDVLVFHSFLLHMSNDNSSNERRSAAVYHYASSDTQLSGIKSGTIDFMPV